MIILAIETSCDETAVAIVKDGKEVLSNIVATQIEEHRLYGGVVPEIASRRHCEAIVGVTQEAIEKANIDIKDIDAIGVTYAPGLIGALLVGVNYAKGLSMSLNKPLIAVHHIRGHISANYIEYQDLKPPFLAFVVSGGHTHLVKVKSYTEYEVIGRTRDDAVGEAYDKVARAMGFEYPGGIAIDRASKFGDSNSYTLPRPKVDGSELDMSFSGLKTAILNIINSAKQKGEELNCNDISASFQYTVCDILVDRLGKAVEQSGYKKVVLAGGVSANTDIREAMRLKCDEMGCEFYVPSLQYCGDNAAMIGVQAYYEYQAGNISDTSLNAVASEKIG